MASGVQLALRSPGECSGNDEVVTPAPQLENSLFASLRVIPRAAAVGSLASSECVRCGATGGAGVWSTLFVPESPARELLEAFTPIEIRPNSSAMECSFSGELSHSEVSGLGFFDFSPPSNKELSERKGTDSLLDERRLFIVESGFDPDFG